MTQSRGEVVGRYEQRVANLRRRVNRARKFPDNTCPASRHLHIMADALLSGRGYPMLQEEPQHCAESILSVLESLWKSRTALNAKPRKSLGVGE
jgi:hypothetical protein